MSTFWVTLQRNGLLRVVGDTYSDATVLDAIQSSVAIWEVQASSVWAAVSALTILLRAHKEPTERPHLRARLAGMDE